MTPQDIAMIISAPLLMLTIIFAFIRLVRGPSLPDRVVALDLMSTAAIGVISLYAISTNEPVFLDVALIVALVAFLGTIAFAYYIVRAFGKTRGDGSRGGYDAARG
ncbi:MAG: cation:proton antiporter [Syntrophobacteraceae bacterium]